MLPPMGDRKHKKQLRPRDKFYHMAKEQGYRSRAAMKLLQLDRSFSFLPTARAVLDLGAAPGGWVQVAVRSAAIGAVVVGVDLKPIWPIRGARLLREDITATARCSAAVRRFMDSKGVTAFDVVLHDGDGKNKKRKRRKSALVIDAVRLAAMFLAPKGTFITKFIGPHDFAAVMFCLQQLFENVQVAKLEASRSMLPEHYFVCLEYKSPAKIQPELFDLKHLLNASLKTKPRDEVRSSMETKSRGITMHGSFTSWKAWNAGRASDFIWSEAQTMQELLVSFMGVSFEDPESLPIKNHELTTEEIQMFCENLDIQDEKTLNHIWEWRMRIRKALSSCSTVIPKPDVAAVDAKVKDDGQPVDKTEEFTSIIDTKTREKSESSCRAKDEAHKTPGMQIDATEDAYCGADLASLSFIKHGKDLRAFDSAEQDMEYGIGDGGQEETQTHEGSNEEVDLDEEQHRYEGILDEAREGFMIKNDKLKRQRKHVNPINPYANADLLEKPSEYVVAKKRVHVREPLVNPLMKDNNTGGVCGEEAKRRRGRVPPERGVFQEKLTRRLDPIMST
ncbi:hypothetical protein QYE76_007225 [Lolium multiflorum]|uniref:Uncharacterized protein n=1 Tax=Lolium multiflorum TaxID=4521 RepID=A0AAD8W2I0_LOLMU|nr:hypothetical protein QYE76_007225 [Lolium multiflorum]